MSTPNLSRTGDDVTDRNFDELKRHLADVAVSGRLGPAQTLVSGSNSLTPALPHPSGRATVFMSPSVTITDVGLNSAGQWVVTASGPCTLRSIWFE